MDAQSSGPSLGVIYEYVKDQVGAQNDQSNALDGKAGFVLGSASLLIAGTASFLAIALDPSSKIIAYSEVVGFLKIVTAISIGLYLALIVAAYQAYKLRAYQAAQQLRLIRDRYEDRTPEDTQGMLLDTMIKIVENNDILIERKATWTSIALRLLIAEAAFLAILVVVQFLVQSVT